MTDLELLTAVITAEAARWDTAAPEGNAVLASLLTAIQPITDAGTTPLVGADRLLLTVGGRQYRLLVADDALQTETVYSTPGDSWPPVVLSTIPVPPAYARALARRLSMDGVLDHISAVVTAEVQRWANDPEILSLLTTWHAGRPVLDALTAVTQAATGLPARVTRGVLLLEDRAAADVYEVSPMEWGLVIRGFQIEMAGFAAIAVPISARTVSAPREVCRQLRGVLGPEPEPEEDDE